MLFSAPRLDSPDRRVLAELETFARELETRVATPQRWTGQLRRSLTAGAIRGSNSIEGYAISESNAEALAAGAPMPESVDRTTAAAVEGYRDAVAYIQQTTTFEIFTYDHTLLSALHFMMTKQWPDRWPGRYRLGGVWGGGGPGNPPAYTAPEAERVPGLMTELLQWLNEDDQEMPSYVRAAMAHLDLLSIHPWRHGNGRMARCLHTAVLARSAGPAPEFLSIEEWIGLSTANVSRYYAALATTRDVYDPGVDTHEWVRFCLRAHHLQAQRVGQRITAAARLWTELHELAGRHQLHERTMSALYAAAMGTLHRTTYEQDEQLSRDQAIRDLQLLKRLDLIATAGTGRAQHYVSGPALGPAVETVRAAVTDRTLREPYARNR